MLWIALGALVHAGVVGMLWLEALDQSQEYAEPDSTATRRQDGDTQSLTFWRRAGRRRSR